MEGLLQYFQTTGAGTEGDVNLEIFLKALEQVLPQLMDVSFFFNV
jgi:hypothetical protein